jgi:hypothetical protein
MKSKKLNTNTLTVTIKDNESGKVLIKEKAGSIIYAAVVAEDKKGQMFNTGVAGEFSLNSLMRSLEAVLDASAGALINSYDLDAEDFIELMSTAMTNSVKRNFSKEEQVKAMIKGMAKMSEKTKSNKKVH